MAAFCGSKGREMSADSSEQATVDSVRINELCRELEVKAKLVIDYLHEVGVTEKKTHSSRISLAAADKVRKHFRTLSEVKRS